LQKTFCHQVGSGHRKLMLESLGLPADRDYTTLQWLGNTGSAALPITMAIGLERGFASPGERLAMLGIGSGINCLMLGVEWQKTLVQGGEFPAQPVHETLAGPHKPARASLVHTSVERLDH
jgi:3-oxoacyl-[acyl-carrier-protein] synthase-3